MPARLTPRQLEFYRELLAPFAPHEIQEREGDRGKMLAYLDKRTLENRLDSVCGPDGWEDSYTPTQRGYMCSLRLRVPDHTEDEISGWKWVTKSDGAGFRGMGAYKKVWDEQTRKMEKTDEWEEDASSDEKSAYTGAFVRVAQDKWGIGRYLYGKGIPTFLDPDAVALAQRQSAPAGAPPVSAPANSGSAPASAPAQAAPANPGNFKIPMAGPGVFSWAKEMERVFETSVIAGMSNEGETQGWGSVFNKWNQGQVNTICLGVMKFLRDLPNYGRQFEYLFPGGVADPKILTQKGSGPNTQSAPQGVNIADLRKGLVDRMKALLEKQIGRAPEIAEVKRVFEAVAANTPNNQGHTGLVPESLSKMTDVTWLNNCIKAVDAQIAATPTPIAGDAAEDDIPF